MRRAWVWLALSLLAPVAPASASDARRYALVVGVSRGDADEEPLRYAVLDAERVASALTTVGGFEKEDVTTVTDVTAEELRGTLTRLDERLRAGGASMLLVFYSGHADGEALHLSGTRLGLDELKRTVAQAAAGTRLLVIDACRSGALTRVKGSKKIPAFEVTMTSDPGAEGLAILTSSASGEDSQESDSLKASFFTHFFVSALYGAADDDRNGDVTLNEAFSYSSRRTLAATAVTGAGPQHPTYRNELSGRGDVTLSRPGAPSRRYGHLRFPEPGWYLISSGDEPVAELKTDGEGASLALVAGRYRVVRRATDHLLLGEVEVPPGGGATVQPEAMNKTAFARVVRKGGTERRHAWNVFAMGGARGPILDLGFAGAAEVGLRLELKSVALELKLGAQRSSARNERLDITTDEFSACLGAWLPYDVGPVSLAGGFEVGGSLWSQRFVARLPAVADSRLVPALSIAGRLGLWVPLGRVHLRLEGGPLFYVLQAGSDAATAKLQAVVTFRAMAGLGFEF